MCARCRAEESPLGSALAKSKGGGGVRMSMSGDVSSAAAGTITFTGSGVADLGGKRGHNTMVMAVPGQGDVRIEQIMDGTSMYVRVPGIGRVLAGGKSWMRMDLEKTGKAAGIDLGSMMQSGGGDPAASLEWLRSADDVEEVGREDVRGVPTTRYEGVVDVADLADTLPETARNAYRENLDKLREAGMPGRFPIEAWVSDDGLMRRIAYTMTMSLPGGVGAMTMHFTIELYDYGTAVDVKPPPAGDTDDVTDAAAATVNTW